MVGLASSAGLDLDLWQVEVVDIIAAENPDGTWSARVIVIIVPRQNGKGSILEAVELYHLFLCPTTRLIIHSAHEFATAQEHFDRLHHLIDSTPDLKSRVAPRGVHRSHGSEGFTLLDGTRLKFKTRTKGGGRGFSGDLVVLDEAMDLPPKAVSALIPTMSAMPNPQVIVTGSAPLDGPESDVLRGLAIAGRAGTEPDMAFMEWCANNYASSTDEAAVQQANPGYPFRVSPRSVATERTMMKLDPEGFRRERLGIWRVDPGRVDAVIPAEKWEACVAPGSRLDGTCAFALDVSPARDSVTFAVAGASTLGGVHVELVSHLDSDAGVVAEAKRLHDRWGFPVAVGKASPAWSLEPDLVAAGVPVRGISTEEHSQACGSLLSAVMVGDLRHLGDARLAAAVEGAAKRTHGDAWLWSRRSSSCDITPIVATTLARWAHLNPLAVEPAKPTYAY